MEHKQYISETTLTEGNGTRRDVPSHVAIGNYAALAPCQLRFNRTGITGDVRGRGRGKGGWPEDVYSVEIAVASV